MITEFKKNHAYRHPGLLDVDVHVSENPRDYVYCWKMKVQYWHRSLKAYIPHFLAFDVVEVAKSEVHKWTELGTVEEARGGV